MDNPVENVALVNAIYQHSQRRSDDTALEVGRQIFSAKFLVPIVSDEMKTLPGSEPKSINMEAGSLIKILNCFNDKGECFLPVFTDWPEIRKWAKSEVDSWVMSFDDVHSLVKNNQTYLGAVINPSSFGWGISRSALHAIQNDFGQ